MSDTPVGVSSFSLRMFRFPEDYPAVIELWSTAGPGVHVGRSDTPEELKKKQQRDPDLFLLALDEQQQVVGSVLGGYDGRRGLIYHLAVAEPFRQAGVGAALMAEVEQRLYHKGCIRCYLLVTRENDTAQRFYEKRGWEAMDTLRIYAKNL